MAVVFLLCISNKKNNEILRWHVNDFVTCFKYTQHVLVTTKHHCLCTRTQTHNTHRHAHADTWMHIPADTWSWQVATQKTCFPDSTTDLCLMQHRSHVLSRTTVLQHGKYDMLKTIFLRKHPVDCPSMMSLQQPFCPKSCLPGFQLTSSSSIAITTSIVAVASAGQKGPAPWLCFFCC